jgi:RNA polymerase sigma-70 factor (ECF subfamily)
MSAAPLTFYLEAPGLGGTARTGLLRQARRGNREAFAEMVAPYVPALYRRARGLTGNSIDAEDATQEALLKAWSRLEQFTGKQDESVDDFRAWVSRIAANASIDLLRQRRSGRVLSLEERHAPDEETLGSTLAAHAHDPEERCARREMGRLLSRAIAQLPRDLRQACLLRDVLQYTTQEVADRLGISVVAVRLRLFRAHRRLRDNLQESLRPAEPRSTRSARSRRGGFVPLDTAAGYASGD